MNWDNFDRLRAHFVGLLDTKNPAFDYRTALMSGGDHNCVACHAVNHCGAVALSCDGVVSNYTSHVTLREFLDISGTDAKFLWVPTDPFGHEADGHTGLRQAIAKMDEVASHYVRPAAAFMANDQAFLVSVRTLAREAQATCAAS